MNVVVIPAYQPDEQLIALVDALTGAGLGVLVVNDGSGPACDPVFKAVARKAVVLHAPENEGKGAALKRGFGALLEHFPDCTHFITADADGQHRAEDILRVRNKLEEGAGLVLTVRRLQGNIPLRSKIGNGLSRVVYTIINGHYFDDNQSGLRGFSVDQLDWLLKVGGNKYDYEMNMLCYADKQCIKITPLPIEAVYIDGNRSSHFNPVADTVRIYKRLFSSVWTSLLGVALWWVLALSFSLMFGYTNVYITVPTAVMIAAFTEVLLDKTVAFRGIVYRDAPRTLLSAFLRSAAYTVVCRIFDLWLPMVPIFVVLNFAAILVIPIEYYLHKAMHKTLNKSGR